MASAEKPKADLAIGVFFLFAAVAWCLAAGKDLNWDMFNYQLYGPHLMIEGRMDRDYFAGSLQSYLNPLVYVPFYLMVMWGWHSIVTGMVLTLVHCGNLYLAWRICSALVPASHEYRRAYLFCGTLLAFLAPLFLAELGTSFADPLTSILVLAALVLSIEEVSGDPSGLKRLAGAGFLLGLASGLKLTNGLFALGIALPLLWATRGQRGRVTRLGVLVLCGVLGGLLAHGYWSFILWKEFGNPLFPLFNNVFRSEDFPPVMYHDRRFVQQFGVQLLTLPFRMMEFRSSVYSETLAPDVRPFALLVLLLLSPFAWRWGRPLQAEGVAPSDLRRLRFVTEFFVLTFVLWAVTSAIGRYAIPLWLTLGPLIAAWVARLPSARWGLIVLAAIIVAQAVELYEAGNERWTPTPWDRQWVEIRVPGTLRNSPHLFLVLGVQSFSAIVPFVHADSSFVNLVGQYILPAGKTMAPRLRTLLERDAGQIRAIITYGAHLSEDGGLEPRIKGEIDAQLSIYGFQLDGKKTCETIEIGLDLVRRWTFSENAGSSGDSREKRPSFQLPVCAVQRVPVSVVDSESDVKDQRVETAFAAVEKACPNLFSPVRGQTLRVRHGWLRSYFNSMNTLMSDGEALFYRAYGAATLTRLGLVRDWVTGAELPNCASGTMN